MFCRIRAKTRESSRKRSIKTAIFLEISGILRIGIDKLEFVEESLMKDKNDLKLSDVMCKWYIWAVVGMVIGNWLSDTLGSLIGLALGSLIGWYIQKNYNKKDNG